MVPFFLAFPELETPQLEIFGNIVTGIFGLDILINFFTAYYDSNLILVDNYKVRVKSKSVYVGYSSSLYDGLALY
jgi:hypothetical protein